MEIKIGRNGRITLPQQLMREANLNEDDLLVARVEQGTIRLTAIDPEQAYFWTERWQEGERKVDEDIAAERVHKFANVEKAIRFLDSEFQC